MIDTARLAEFARENDLEFVALFGSRARGGARPGSDYDLALEPCRWNAVGGRLQAGMALARALGRGDVDAAWLPHASWILWARVAREGQALYEKVPGAFRRFCTAARLEASDSDLWRCRQLEGIRRSLAKHRWVDLDLIRQKLAQLAEVLGEMRSLVDVPREAFVAEVMRYWAAERSLLLLIEYAAAINAEIASGSGIPPSDYYSSFFSAAAAGWIEHELAGELAPLASLRNVLVHVYEKIKVSELYDTLHASVPAWENYLQAILGRL